jgi:DNA-binding NtrC family response regulator
MPAVLVVDPDPKLASSLAGLLTGRGFQSLTAASADQALKRLEEGSFDLILTEIQLPGTSGFDFIRAARARDPGLPFVVLANEESFWWAREAIRLGARDYLVKHLDRVDVLVESVERVVRTVRQERETRELLNGISNLQDEFLRSLVHLDRQNLELQERLDGAPAEAPSPYRILVVDDEPLVCGVLRDLFVEHGFQVEVANTAERAMAWVDSGSFDLVVTDKNLPGMSGLDLLRRVKERNPEVEVLIVTGYASLDSAIEAIDWGASGYLLKPFENLDEVLSKVNEIRRRQQFRAQAPQFLERFKARNRDLIEKYQEVRRRLAELVSRTPL